MAAAPDGVSFLHGISAIGTKFHPAPELGPASRRAVAHGLYQGVVWLRLAGRDSAGEEDPGLAPGG